MRHHQVIVIGAGHAGVEAAWAAARTGADVAICTLSRETIAHMPCNPAIGGTAKGHLVREVDALGGLMGLAIDATGIQFKLLNRSRGPAVWSPRAQADKRAYGAWVRQALEREPRISWIDGRAGSVVIEQGRVAGLRLEDGDEIACTALVITTGTFLNGLIHIGTEQKPAGRAGEPPSVDLAKSLIDIRLRDRKVKNRHAATAAPPQHRFFVSPRGARGRCTGCLLISHRSYRAGPGRVPSHVYDLDAARSRAAAHRRVTAIQRTDFGDWPALLPFSRRQGDAVPGPRAPPSLPGA